MGKSNKISTKFKIIYFLILKILTSRYHQSVTAIRGLVYKSQLLCYLQIVNQAYQNIHYFDSCCLTATKHYLQMQSNDVKERQMIVSDQYFSLVANVDINKVVIGQNFSWLPIHKPSLLISDSAISGRYPEQFGLSPDGGLYRKWCCFGQNWGDRIRYANHLLHSVSHYSVWKFHSQSMDKLKKALSGDDDDEESGIVTQVKRKSYLWMLSFINFAEIEMIVNDVSCGLKIEQSTCTAFINLMNII